MPKLQFLLLLVFGSLALVVSVARADFAVERVTRGLNAPTYVTHAPGDNESLFIVERNEANSQLGSIKKYDLMTGQTSMFLDVTGSVVQDGGLVGVEFHPDYASNGLFYVVAAANRTNYLDEYRVVGGVPQLQRRILEYQALANVFHTIDQVHFRPNGNNNELYVLTGDGGTQANQGSFNPALIQDPNSIYGKIMRVDLSASFPTPAGDATHPGIDVLALGIRNPFRSSFDRATGDFYFGDVGFSSREEIDFIPASHMANQGAAPLDFGWVEREGMIQTPHPPGGPGSPGDINPIFEYRHSGAVPPAFNGFAVIGGYVYRGPVTELVGRYFFAEHIFGNVYSSLFDTNTNPASYNGANLTDIQNHTVNFETRIGAGANIQFVSSYGEDPLGNLYIVKIGTATCPACPLGSGEVFRAAPTVADALDVTIDRGLGTILLKNTSASPVAFTSLAIASSMEAVETSNLTPITGNYDSGGNMQVDDEAWSIISPPGSLTVFRESTTGDAGSLDPGEEIFLSLGDGWTRSPTEDVFVGMLLDDGMVISADVTFENGFGHSYRRSDFNFNDAIDPIDWSIFLANHNADLSSFSLAEAYALGDLNGDRKNDFLDFRLFQADFIDENGEAAFAALPGAIPEPAAALLLLTGAIASLFVRRRA